MTTVGSISVGRFDRKLAAQRRLFVLFAISLTEQLNSQLPGGENLGRGAGGGARALHAPSDLPPIA
jgi:hypothetical protein